MNAHYKATWPAHQYDHHHEECARLPCPCCGCDPKTGRHIPDDIDIKQWSCSLCDTCWHSYEADMAPEERATYVIEEQTL